MNPNTNILRNAVYNDEQNLLNNPGTELAQRALKNRIWDTALASNCGQFEISETVVLETLHQVGYAWAAGFMDGEGCVSLARVHRNCGNRINYRVRVNLVQNCIETLKTFRDYAGETVC